jgi:hypothetical protein
LNKRLRAQLPEPRRRDLILRDLSEAMQLALPGFAPRPPSAAKRAAAAGPPPAAAASAAQQLPGRLWRAARGEAGPAGAAGTAAAGHHPAPPPPGTRYEHVAAPAAPLVALYAAAGRVAGAPRSAWRASGQNGQGEAGGRLFDGSAATKWLDFGGGGAGGQGWVEFRLPSTAEPVAVTSYTLVSASDAPERDPAHVLLECVPLLDAGCSGEGGASDSEAWAPLDERAGVKFSARGQLLNFTVPANSRAPARRWRLRVLTTADPAAANSVQLAAWEFFAAPAVAEGAVAAKAPAGGGCGGGGGEGAREQVAVAPSADGEQQQEEEGGEILYLGETAREGLRALAAEAAAAAGAGAPGGAAGAGGALSLLRRVAGNVLVEPVEAKFFQLRGDKVGGVVSCAGSR